MYKHTYMHIYLHFKRFPSLKSIAEQNISLYIGLDLKIRFENSIPIKLIRKRNIINYWIFQGFK